MSTARLSRSTASCATLENGDVVTHPVAKKTFICTFGGGGGGAKGFQQSKASLFGREAVFDLIGSFDKDPYACKNFEYFTGVPQTCIDVREITPAMMREFFGDAGPFAIQGSPPCTGLSKLLSSAKSKTATYALLNELALVSTRLILDAYAHDLPAFIFYENVPNITSRGRPMLAEVRKIIRAAGYAWQDGYHECRHVGNLAQRRKRWFGLARLPSKVPGFVYLPPHQPGKVCGDVLNDLPVPGAEEGGPMHRLPEISALNWWRLWAIPPGGDWRDLLQDGRPKREKFRRHHVEAWTEPSVTIGGSGSNGPCGVADPRFKGSLGVLSMDEASGAVTGEAYPSTGRFAVADPIARKAAYGFGGALGVLNTSEPSPTVTGKAGATTGRFAIADKQSLLALNLGPSAHDNLYQVVGAGEPSKTVTGATRPGSGAVSYAAPLNLTPQAGNAAMHHGKYIVVALNQPAKTVTGAGRVGSGAQSIAQPMSHKTFRGRWGVLAANEPSGTVTGNARIATGANAIAAPPPLDLVPKAECFPKGYAVIDRATQPSLAIAATTSVGCGTYSITDAVPTAEPATGAPSFVALSYAEAKRVADGEVAAPFAIVDPERPDEPLAIVDDMTKPPFRWVGAGKKRRKVAVPLVLVSEDGTWHRPLTTLELAVLQGLPWQHKGKALDFGGGSTSQRTLIGNMIPTPVGQAIGDEILKAGIAADAGAFFLTNGSSGVWVRPEHRARLIALGVRSVRPADARRVPVGQPVIVDDAAPRWRARKMDGPWDVARLESLVYQAPIHISEVIQ